MKTILKNKWIIAAALIFGFASFANAGCVHYPDSINDPNDCIDKSYQVDVPSTCSVYGEIYIYGICQGHVEVWRQNGGQILSLDSTQWGTVFDSVDSQPADTYYTDHWGVILQGPDSLISLRTVICWN